MGALLGKRYSRLREDVQERPPLAPRVMKDNGDAIWPWVYALRAALVEDLDTEGEMPMKISPNVLIGSAASARKLERLRELRVSHVLNLGGSPARNPDVDFAGAGIQHVTIATEDEEGYEILRKHLTDCRATIARARAAASRCLVHCVAGLNRSGVICCAELMLSEHLPVLEAVRRCRAARGSHHFLGNRSFQVQLVTLAAERGLLGPRPEGFSAEPPAPESPPKRAADALARLAL